MISSKDYFDIAYERPHISSPHNLISKISFLTFLRFTSQIDLW